MAPPCYPPCHGWIEERHDNDRGVISANFKPVHNENGSETRTRLQTNAQSETIRRLIDGLHTFISLRLLLSLPSLSVVAAMTTVSHAICAEKTQNGTILPGQYIYIIKPEVLCYSECMQYVSPNTQECCISSPIALPHLHSVPLNPHPSPNPLNKRRHTHPSPLPQHS